MKIKTLVLTGLVSGISTTYAGEIPVEKCPAAVQQTIQANLRDGKVDEVDEIKIEDQALYVAQIDLPGGKDLDVHVKADGKLLKTSEDIAPTELPAAVTSAVGKLTASGGRLDDADKEVADGKTTYRVEIDRDKAPDLNAVFGEDGTLISQTEEAND